MALQASGQIKVSEILTEGGVSSTLADTSLYNLENDNIFTVNQNSANKPDQSIGANNAISEWYSYDHDAVLNDFMWTFASSGQGLRFARTSGTTMSTSVDMCVSLWINPEWAASDTNVQLFDFNNSTTLTTNRFFLLYDYGLNRFIARLRTNGTNSRGTHWNLNTNSSQTGISSGTWHGTQKGNTNSASFVHIVLTYDSSATTGQAAFDIYWNGVKLPTKLTNLTGSIFNFDFEHIAINRACNGTGSSRESSYDNFAFFHNKMLSQTEITNLYNSGLGLPPEQVGEDDNVAFVFDAEDDPPVATSGNDYTTAWNNTVDVGSKVSY